MGSAIDRFALNYQLLHCIIDQRPWNCKPDNIMQASSSSSSRRACLIEQACSVCRS